jgi:HlyD family secretion protein
VQKGNVTAKVTASGTLSAIVTVQVGAQVSGRIAEIPKGVDFNAKVTKGEVIAKIDPQLFEAAVEQAQANYNASVASLNKAKVQAADAVRIAKRSKALLADKLVAQADYDTAQATADAAEAQVKAADAAVEQNRASLHMAQVNLGYTTIVSPIDGVVISRAVDVGQTVASALQTPTLFTIAEDLRKMQVDTSVAEADVGRLRDQMSATFTVDAYPGERFTGTVRQIRSAPQTVQNVVTYDAVIDLENPELRPGELKLKPGMTANVTFIWAERDNVITVPNAALRFRPPGMQGGGRGNRGGAGGGSGPWAGGGGGQGRRHGAGGASGPTGAAGGEPEAGTEVAQADGDAGPRHHRHRDNPDGASADGVANASPKGEGKGDGKGDGKGPGGPGGPSPDDQAAGSQPASQPHRRRNAGSTVDDAMDRRTVWVLRGENAQPQPIQVKTGITDGSFTEIVEGDLHEGDVVITDLVSDEPKAQPQGGPGGGPGGGMRMRF